MNRKCPGCSSVSVPVSGLIVSDALCPTCAQTVSVYWLFRAIFGLVVAAVTAVVGLVVLIDQGLYAALLIISLPIGAIGFVKARFCPLVVRRSAAEAKSTTS